MWPNPQFPEDLVTFTEEILNGKLRFSCSICYETWRPEVAVMQTEKALINDHVRVSKVSWKFRIPTIYSFAVIYSWKFAIFFCLFTKKTLRLSNLKTRIATNAKILVFIICVGMILCYYIICMTVHLTIYA